MKDSRRRAPVPFGHWLVLGLALACLVLTIAIVVAQKPVSSSRRTLTAELYPYLPDAPALYRQVEQDFEAKYPAIDLILHVNMEAYYDAGKGLLSAQADVYEADCVFLTDLIAKGRIQPVSGSPARHDFALGDVVNQKNACWGVPHWLCGNFLFYDKGDVMSRASCLTDYEQMLKKAGGDLLVDMKGKTTLGELYATALLAEGMRDGQMEASLRSPALNAGALNRLRRLVHLLPNGLGRDGALHDVPGYYAAQFARGQGRAYVGYSENASFMMREKALGLPSSSVRDLAFMGMENFRLSDTDTGRCLGWVDALAIDRKCTGQKLADCHALIAFLMSDDFYRNALAVTYSNANGRYLLPPSRKFYRAGSGLDNTTAAFYQALLPAVGRLRSFTMPGLNEILAAKGKEVDAALAQPES